MDDSISSPEQQQQHSTRQVIRNVLSSTTQRVLRDSGERETFLQPAATLLLPPSQRVSHTPAYSNNNPFHSTAHGISDGTAGTFPDVRSGGDGGTRMPSRQDIVIDMLRNSLHGHQHHHQHQHRHHHHHQHQQTHHHRQHEQETEATGIGGGGSTTSPISQAVGQVQEELRQVNEMTSELRQIPEVQLVVSYARKAIPFFLIIFLKNLYEHRLGLGVCIGLFTTAFYANRVIKTQVSLKEKRQYRCLFGVILLLTSNIALLYYTFDSQKLYRSLLLLLPNFDVYDFWVMTWIIGITDFVIKFVGMALKSVIVLQPRGILPFKRRGKYYLVIEELSQFYRTLTPITPWIAYIMYEGHNGGSSWTVCVFLLGMYTAFKFSSVWSRIKELKMTIKSMLQNVSYGSSPSHVELSEVGDICPICQDCFTDPIQLSSCKHIFCEDCVAVWLDREQTCPMCRATITHNPKWRDGNTSSAVQLF